MSRPDFVGIGAQKAGTTWLHDNLEIQPGLWLPPEKELHFFNRVCPNEELIGLEARGLPPWPDRYRPALRRPSLETLRWLRRFHYDPPSTTWYRRLFPDALVGGRVAGEITPAYSTLDRRGVSFARRVLSPRCRVFFIVRNPVDRAWSGIKMQYRWWDSDIRSAEVESVLDGLETPTHRLRGDYPRIVALWRELFGAEFKVFLYDDLVDDSTGFLRDVAAFIGLDADLDLSRVEVRSNRDPEARRMPDAVRRHLRSRYEPQILALDRLVRGVADRWLS